MNSQVKNSLPAIVFWLGAGVLLGWLIPRQSHREAESDHAVLINREDPVSPRETAAVSSAPAQAPPARTRAKGGVDVVTLPKAAMKYFGANAVDTVTMEFKADMLRDLGLIDPEISSLNATLKNICKNAADFQIRHAVAKTDPQGGEYYLIKQPAEEKAAVLAQLENMIHEAVPAVDPAIATAVWNFVKASPVLTDFKFSSQEVSVIESGGFSDDGSSKQSIELNQFDENGQNVGRQMFLATPELVKNRFPFLK